MRAYICSRSRYGIYMSIDFWFMLVFAAAAAAADGEYSFSNNKNYDRIWNSKKDMHCIEHMPHPAHNEQLEENPSSSL